MAEKKKLRRIDPEGRTYKRANLELILSVAPSTHPCAKCSWPVLDGYCCRYCGTDEP